MIGVPAFLRRHWLPIVLGVVIAAIVAKTVAIDADRDAQRALAAERGQILDASVAAAGVANGWPATKRLKVDQLPEQIQRYGKAFDQVRLAAQTARADGEAQARAIEARDAKISKEHQDELSQRMATELRRAADYARRLRDQLAGLSAAGTDRGAGEAGGAAAHTDAAAAADRTGSTPLLDEDDIRICTANTVKAEGWQDWYRETFAQPR
jgi:hypothetical protein